MKFSSLSEKSEKIYRVRKLDGGINNSELPNNIADNELTKAENMDFCDGVLQTRPGLSATEYDIIKNESLFPESQILYNWFHIMEADKHTTRYFCDVIEQFHTRLDR